MKIKFYITDREANVFTCYLTNADPGDKVLIKRNSRNLNRFSRTFLLNSYDMYLFLNEINNCDTYRLCVARYIKSESSPYIIQLIPNKRAEYIDYPWGEIVRQLVWEQLEIDYMFSWFSTLGGAFSALGDYFTDKAEIAGKISFQQMKLAVKLGDPNLLARCRLFLSISLIQQLKFKLARRIIKEQYEHSKQVSDTRLQKMCLGIWSKLQYTRKIHKAKTKAVTFN